MALTQEQKNIQALAQQLGADYKGLIQCFPALAKLYGVKGDGVTDDAPALQALLNSPAIINLSLPAGRFICGSALTRTDKGAFCLTGAGQGATTLEFKNDTDGLVLTNAQGATLGVIQVTDLTIVTSGTKSAGRRALVLATQHEKRPGAIIQRINFSEPAVSANEWSTFIDVSDCSGTCIQAITGFSKTLTKTSFIRVHNTTNRPNVEHNWHDLYINSVKIAFDIATDGQPGIEGVHISNTYVVSCKQGFVGVSNQYKAPEVDMVNVHINSFGGECFYADKMSQLQFANCLFYCNVSGGVTPTQAVYIKDATNVSGFLMIYTFGAIPHQVYLDGSTAGFKVAINGICDTGSTHIVTIGAGCVNAEPDASRFWTGENGALTGKIYNDLSGFAQVPLKADPSTLNPSDGSILQYNATTFRWAAVYGATKVKVTAAYTFKASDVGKSFFVSANNLTLTIPAGLPIGWYVNIWNNGNATTTTVATGAANVYINGNNTNNGKNKVSGAFGQARLEALDPDWYGMGGNVTT